MSTPDGIVGLLADRTPDVLTGILGILESGNAFLPLGTELPDERLAFMLADCGVRTLVTQERHRARAERLAARVATLEHIICTDTDCAGPGPAEVPAPPEEDLDRLCYVIYTSGSTGRPKGVAVTHRNLAPLLAWSIEYFGLEPGTTVLQNLNPAFDFGVWELLTTICSGGTLHAAGRRDAPDFAELAATIDRDGIDVLHTTPSFFAELLAVGRPLPGLRVVHLGGEEVTGALLADAYRLLSPRCEIYNGYGPTEATVNCAIHRVDRDATGRVPIGRASANNRLYVVNERLEPVPPGVPGELVVGGDGVAAGYLGHPELTRERFVPDAVNGGRLYRTGDRVRYRPDGLLEFLGRIDDQVKLRGHRVEPAEVEAVLARHPMVRAATVVVRPDGGGVPRLIGYVVPATEAPGDLPGELREYAQERLPGVMVPAAFVTLDRLPLTPNGKVDRQALPAPVVTTGTEEPDGPVEKALAEIFAEVLGLDRVGARDGFFDLGGHSLLVTRAVARIRDSLAVDLPLHSVFEHPAVADLAVVVEKLRADEGPVAEIVSLGIGRERELLEHLDELSDEQVEILLATLADEGEMRI